MSKNTSLNPAFEARVMARGTADAEAVFNRIVPLAETQEKQSTEKPAIAICEKKPFASDMPYVPAFIDMTTLYCMRSGAPYARLLQSEIDRITETGIDPKKSAPLLANILAKGASPSWQSTSDTALSALAKTDPCGLLTYFLQLTCLYEYPGWNKSKQDFTGLAAKLEWQIQVIRTRRAAETLPLILVTKLNKTFQRFYAFFGTNYRQMSWLPGTMYRYVEEFLHQNPEYISQCIRDALAERCTALQNFEAVRKNMRSVGNVVSRMYNPASNIARMEADKPLTQYEHLAHTMHALGFDDIFAENPDDADLDPAALWREEFKAALAAPIKNNKLARYPKAPAPVHKPQPVTELSVAPANPERAPTLLTFAQRMAQMTAKKA